MGRYEQNKNSHGSLKDIQVLINDKKRILDNELNKHLNNEMIIEWVSPLENDNYSEYRDDDFLKVLGIDNKIKVPLNKFWPKRGPQWDALGKYNDNIFIVEAKANIPELKSHGTKASPKSKKLIEKSLNVVKEYLNINNSFNWMDTYYQYTNRIAHLYYLRILNDINAYLIFIYFINDISVNGPKTIDEWKYEISELYKKIGLTDNNILSKYIIDIFVDYNELKQ
jgi:hypothetical protein